MIFQDSQYAEVSEIMSKQPKRKFTKKNLTDKRTNVGSARTFKQRMASKRKRK